MKDYERLKLLGSKAEDSIISKLSGLKVEDTVTGFKCVIISISFELYGCVQARVKSSTCKNGAIPDSRWIDVTRLAIKK